MGKPSGMYRVRAGGIRIFIDRKWNFHSKGLKNQRNFYGQEKFGVYSIQYRKEEKGQIIFSSYENGEKLCLCIEDNGKGVSEVDLPFVFEKGFTGSNGQENKKSTGIGLYLVKKLAENMKLVCSAKNREAGGFRLIIEFPKVEKEEIV